MGAPGTAVEMIRVEGTDGPDLMEGTEDRWIHGRRSRGDHGCRQCKCILGVLRAQPLHAHRRTQEHGGILAVQHVLCALNNSCVVNFSFQ